MISQPGSPRTRIRAARARDRRCRRRSGASASACWRAGRRDRGGGPRACGRRDSRLARMAREHALDRLDRRARERDVVAHRVDVAAGAAEVGLHVDDDEAGVGRREVAVEGPGVGVGGDGGGHGGPRRGEGRAGRDRKRRARRDASRAGPAPAPRDRDTRQTARFLETKGGESEGRPVRGYRRGIPMFTLGRL